MDNQTSRKAASFTRRRFLKGSLCGVLVWVGAASLAACAPRALQNLPEATRPVQQDEPLSIMGGPAAPGGLATSLPRGNHTVRAEGIGDLTFQAQDVATVRPDIFQEGHFSLFDVLVHLGERGSVQLDYHMDEKVGTHVIDAINGRRGWWYDAYYAGGWSEQSIHRMDLYPYKAGTTLRLYREDEGRLGQIHRTFEEEVARLSGNGGRVIVPDVRIEGPRGSWSFSDVEVTPHNLRADLLKTGTVTALDILLSLLERGDLSRLRLTWYGRIGAADPVNHYFADQINDAVSSGGCGFVYEVGPRAFAGFRGNHIHLPSDARIVMAPDYGHWFWLCL